MTLKRNALTDAAAGVNFTTTNTGVPDAFTYVDTAGGTIVRDTTPGTSVLPMWAKVDITSSAATALGFSITASNKAVAHTYFYFESGGLAGTPRILGLSSGTPTVYADLRIGSTGALSLANNAGTTVWTSTSTMSVNTIYRIEMAVDNTGGAGATIVTINTYAAGSNTPISGLSYSNSAWSTGTGTMARAYFGREFGSAASGTFWLGDMAAQDGVTTEVGQYVTSSTTITITDSMGLVEYPDDTVIADDFIIVDDFSPTYTDSPTITAPAAAVTAVALTDFVLEFDLATTSTPATGTPSWTDLTGYLVASDPVSAQRGRSNEFDTALQPGTAAFGLRNTDGRFTYGNASSPYAPLQLRRPCRFAVTYAGTRYPMWAGFVDTWGNRAETVDEGRVRVSASDRLARAAATPLRSNIANEILATNPLALFPLTEDSGSATAGDVSGNLGYTTLSQGQVGAGGSFDFTEPSAGIDGGTAAEFAPASAANGLYLAGRLWPTMTRISSITLSVFVKPDVVNRQQTLMTVSQANNSSSSQAISFGLNASGIPYVTIHDGGGPQTATAITDIAVTDYSHLAVNIGYVSDFGAAGFYSITFFTNGVLDVYRSIGQNRVYADSVYLGGDHGAGGAYMFDGHLSFASVHEGGLALAEVAAIADAGRAFYGETTDARFTHLCQQANLPTSAYQTLGASATTMGSQPTGGLDLLSAVRDIVQTEAGVVYTNADGVVTFAPRTVRYNAPVGLTLDATKPGQVPTDFSLDTDTNMLLNDVTVNRSGGATQRIVDQASIDNYDQAEQTLNIFAATDQQAADAASWLVHTSSTPQPRTKAITVDVVAFANSGGNVDDLLSADIGTRLQITNLPSNVAASSTLDLFIEGITYEYTRSVFTVTFTTSPMGLSGSIFTIGSSTYGVLDSSSSLAF